jgi:transposase
MARKFAVIMHAIWRDGTVYADRLHASGMSDAAPTAKDRKLLGAQA